MWQRTQLPQWATHPRIIQQKSDPFKERRIERERRKRWSERLTTDRMSERDREGGREGQMRERERESERDREERKNMRERMRDFALPERNLHCEKINCK